MAAVEGTAAAGNTSAAGPGRNSPAGFVVAGHSLAGVGSSPAVGAGRRRSSRSQRRGFDLAVVGSRGRSRGPGQGKRVAGLSRRGLHLACVL